MRPVFLAPLIAAVAAGPVAAQATRPATDAALVIAAVPVAAPTHRIFTLAWTSERLPGSVARTATVPLRPSAHEEDRIFTLAWQPVTTGPAPARPVGLASGSGCTIMVLVTQPCAAR